MKLFSKKESGEPRKKLGCLGKTVVGLVVYFGLCGLFGVWMGNAFSTPETKLESQSIYKINMDGVLVEQGREANPFESLMGEAYGKNTEVIGLDDLVSNIQLAKENDKIQGIYLYGGKLGMGQASAKALRDALLDFKTSGKWIIAYADSYTQLNYYVCSVADSIYLNPVGSLDWKGVGAQKMYYTRVMEKIGVEMQILKVGTFKSAVEPFFRTSMSDADRYQTMQYITGVWDVLKQGVSESRGIAIEQLDNYADEFLGLQDVEKYLAYGLVDSLCYIQDMDSVLAHRIATADYHLVSTSEMTNVKRTESKAKDKVAIIYAEGEITDDSGDGIVGTKMVKTIKKVAKNEDVKAVVLRVNSPGGSANASEQIWHAMRTLQEKGLPVVVSMGDYAASGGYYISCEADYIIAQPNTLTGSIGIFGTVPSFAKLRDKIGLDIDGIGTNQHSNLESNMVYQGMNSQERALMQQMVERGYELFTSRCAEGRHMAQDDIKKIGEGRVWLGAKALEIGLVDSLGNMDDAVAKAAQLAGLEDYARVSYPEKKDFMTELMEMLDNSTPEEKLMAKIRAFVSKPRIMAKMEDIIID